MQNFTYLIGDVKTRECVVVDPAWEIDRILKTAAEADMKITGALVTHAHYDHVNGVAELLEATDGKVYVNKHEAEFLKVSRAGNTGLFINITGPNLIAVDSGDHLKVGALDIQFIHTPGHTPGSQCFLVNNHLVSGDTLFVGTCGRCDLPGSDPKQLYESLTQKLAKLDPGTLLFPGHNYFDEPSATMAEAKEQNPYLRLTAYEQFDNFISRHL